MIDGILKNVYDFWAKYFLKRELVRVKAGQNKIKRFDMYYRER